jgi:N-acetylmuramoyl-L-alanine amidase
MIITEKLLPINEFSRPGYRRPETLGIVYHWVGAAGQKNDATARYFELLADQDPTDKKPDRYASAHYIIGMDGEIIRCIPDNEVAYHVGAQRYTSIAQHSFRGYTTNGRQGTPNWCTIGIELCHPDETGHFTSATLESAARLGKHLMHENLLGTHDIYRHYDITLKLCPKWFAQHEGAWLAFIEDIAEVLL